MISEVTGIQRGAVIVYTENDPRKSYTEDYLYKNSPKFKEEYTAKLGQEYPDDKKPTYGQEYIDEYMAALKTSKDSREITMITSSPLMPAPKFEKPDNSKFDMGKTNEVGPFTDETRDKK